MKTSSIIDFVSKSKEKLFELDKLQFFAIPFVSLKTGLIIDGLSKSKEKSFKKNAIFCHWNRFKKESRFWNLKVFGSQKVLIELRIK